MAKLLWLSAVCLLLSCASLTDARLIDYDTCGPQEGYTLNCDVHEVQIDNCKKSSSDYCKIKRGKSVSISVDFTPKFTANTLESQPFWVVNENTDKEFTDMNRNACLTTQCPTVANQRQTYTYSLTTSRLYPVGVYDVKWYISSEDKKLCCFIFKLGLSQ